MALPIYTIGLDDALAYGIEAAKLAARTLWEDGAMAVCINRPPVWVYRGATADARRAVGRYGLGGWLDYRPRASGDQAEVRS